MWLAAPDCRAPAGDTRQSPLGRIEVAKGIGAATGPGENGKKKNSTG